MPILDTYNVNGSNYTVADSRINDLIELKNISNNIVNPATFKEYEDRYDALTGQKASNSVLHYQSTENLIPVGSQKKLYFYTDELISSVHELYVLEYHDSISNHVTSTGNFRFTNGYMGSLTLRESTNFIALQTTARENVYDTSNLCVSFYELDGFEPYQEGWVLKDSSTASTGVMGSTLYRKNIAFFGDSIIDNNIVVNRFSSMTGAICTNFAKGGTSASILDRPTSLCTIANAIYTEDWSTFIANATAADAARYTAWATNISQYDYANCDIMVFHYGSNDTYTGADDPSNPLDTDIFAGAIRYSIEKIQSKHPQIRIFISDVINSLGQPKPYRAEAMAKLKEICDEYHVGYIDNYTNFGINNTTASVLLSSDVIHLSDIGKELLAANFARNIW